MRFEFFLFLVFVVFVNILPASETKVTFNDILLSENSSFHNIDDNRPNALIKIFKKRIQRTKRGVAAALAFPLPFGVLALHRIYLTTAPHVPVVYIGSVGGVFGILPFIDFCVLALDRDIERFYNNGRVFMWIEENKSEQ